MQPSMKLCNVPLCMNLDCGIGLCEKHRREYVGGHSYRWHLANGHKYRVRVRTCGNPAMRKYLNPPLATGDEADEETCAYEGRRI